MKPCEKRQKLCYGSLKVVLLKIVSADCSIILTQVWNGIFIFNTWVRLRLLTMRAGGLGNSLVGFP